MSKPVLLILFLFTIFPCKAQYPVESPDDLNQKEIRKRYADLGITQKEFTIYMFSYPGQDTIKQTLSSEKYDKQGNILESSTGNIRNTFFYNEKGKLVIRISYQNDTLYNKTEYAYDTKNRLFQESHTTYYDPDMPPEHKGKEFIMKHGYSDVGDTLRCVTINASGDWIRTMEKFKENNLVTVIRTVNPGYGLSREKKWFFDSDGRIIKCTDEDFARNKKKEYRYEYDEYGNSRRIGEEDDRLNTKLFYNNDHLVDKIQVYDDKSRVTNEFVIDFIK